MGARIPGALGLFDIGTVLDSGTLNRQRSGSPGPVSGNGNRSYVHPGPILVGKPFREPGMTAKDPEGKTAQYEDMIAGDAPAKADSLKQDPVFQLKDAKLEEMGKALMNNLSVGDLNTVALEAWDRFCKGTGGTYRNDKLDEKVRDNGATTDFCKEFEKDLYHAILDSKCNLNSFPPITMGNYSFDSLTDKAGGLGILIHDIWSIKADIKDYTGTWDKVSKTGAFYGTLVYTMTDDFGLDWHDIEEHGNDIFPDAHTGDQFKAWYILQHFRKAKPFFIEMKVERRFEGDNILTPIPW